MGKEGEEGGSRRQRRRPSACHTNFNVTKIQSSQRVVPIDSEWLRLACGIRDDNHAVCPCSTCLRPSCSVPAAVVCVGEVDSSIRYGVDDVDRVRYETSARGRTSSPAAANITRFGVFPTSPVIQRQTLCIRCLPNRRPSEQCPEGAPPRVLCICCVPSSGPCFTSTWCHLDSFRFTS